MTIFIDIFSLNDDVFCKMLGKIAGEMKRNFHLCGYKLLQLWTNHSLLEPDALALLESKALALESHGLLESKASALDSLLESKALALESHSLLESKALALDESRCSPHCKFQ
jgi:hypothetical protein